MGYLAGIDLGTSSAKVLIMDTEGTILGKGSATYRLNIPEISFAEQDPEQWWDAVKKALQSAVSSAGLTPGQIDAIGFSGQMHGLTALDADKKPVCPAVIHLDQRSAGVLKELRSKAGELMTQELLNQPGAGMLISTLYWIKKERPRLLESIRYVMSPKDYIRFRFCGEIGTDVTDAAASLGFSVQNRRWCTELFSRLGLPEEFFSRVHESFEVAGLVSKKASLETGLTTDTKVVFGSGDSLAALTGIGVVDAGAVVCNIGTASQLAAVADQPLFDPQLRLQTWCHTQPGRWAIQCGALNGGSILSWFRSQVLKTDIPFSRLDQEAMQIPAGAEGLLFLPYLSGERTPWNDPKAKGVCLGLGMKHTQAHLIRAAMEGIMFNLKECLGILDEMNVRRRILLASGGAARGLTWKQIQADMLNMPVHTAQVEEEACQGAAILAAVGTGAYPDIPSACTAIVKMSDEITEPIPENVRLYQEKQAIFHDLYASIKHLE